jgi:hypothetical protein
MKPTPEDEIVNDGWYWVRRHVFGERIGNWEVMRAQVGEKQPWFEESEHITWWEVMKDWETEHFQIAFVGPRIEEPSNG